MTWQLDYNPGQEVFSLHMDGETFNSLRQALLQGAHNGGIQDGPRRQWFDLYLFLVREGVYLSTDDRIPEEQWEEAVLHQKASMPELYPDEAREVTKATLNKLLERLLEDFLSDRKN